MLTKHLPGAVVIANLFPGAVVVTKHLPGAVVVVNLSPVGQWW